MSLYVGVDMGGTSVKVAAVSQCGEVAKALSLASEVDRGPEHVQRQIERGITELFERYGKENFVAVGVGAAGSVDESGVVKYPPNFPGWQEEPLGERLRKFTGLPVWVDNDANVAAIGEAKFGAGVGFTDFLCITLGTGVGGGLFLRGEIYRGPGFAAGEVGHVSVDMSGPRCNCGSYGCLERLVGARYIVERAVEKLRRDATGKLIELVDGKLDELTPKLINDAAEAGDAVALEVLRETGEIIGVAMASVINLLNLQRIIVSGGVAQAGDLIFRPLRETLYARALPVPRSQCDVVAAQLGPHAGVIGAAALAMSSR
jgi:glucokinase